jgi:apolipoprotein N-acyltransferase
LRGVRWSTWIAGIVFNVLMFWWIIRLPVHAMTHPWLIYPALAALGLHLGLTSRLWLAVIPEARLGTSILFLAPFVWTVIEWASLRARSAVRGETSATRPRASPPGSRARPSRARRASPSGRR